MTPLASYQLMVNALRLLVPTILEAALDCLSALFGPHVLASCKHNLPSLLLGPVAQQPQLPSRTSAHLSVAAAVTCPVRMPVSYSQVHPVTACLPVCEGASRLLSSDIPVDTMAGGGESR